MHKFFPVISFSFLSITAFTQIPAGYYNNAYTGSLPKTCATLKTALFTIITADTTNLFYNSPDGSFDTQDAVNKLDIHRNDDNTADIIWDMYTDNPSGPELYSFTPVTSECGGSFPPEVGACYNREHTFPLSWFNNQYPMRSDVHHIFATDGETNAMHANWPYGEVGSVEWQSLQGSKLGSCSFPGYTGKVFEPIDEYKGDFARAMFYMVTCYENLTPGWLNNGIADSVLNGTTWPSLDTWAIKQWYKWHLQDPVSQKEINRNDSIYTFQHNRNPYIDHPEYVALVWQCTGLLPVTLIDFTATKSSLSVGLHWTVSGEAGFSHYEIERSTDGISFNTIGVVQGQNSANYFSADNNLPSVRTVFYRLKMVDIDGKFTYSKTAQVSLNRNAIMISVYPNPAVNDVMIALRQPLKAGSHLKVTDITGKELVNKTLTGLQSNIKLDIRQMPAGRYFITVAGNNDLLYDSFLILR